MIIIPFKTYFKINDIMDEIYLGKCECHKPHGIGSKTYDDLSDDFKFDGHWYNGKRQNGTLIYKNGDSFTGSFKNDRRYNGTLTFAISGNLNENKETRR
jgi:hypothetical protein